MNKVIGQVTPEERKAISHMYEKKVALQNLLLMDISEQYRDQISEDLDSIIKDMENWWSEMASKYNWPGAQGMHWEVDFRTGEIILVKETNVKNK